MHNWRAEGKQQPQQSSAGRYRDTETGCRELDEVEAEPRCAR